VGGLAGAWLAGVAIVSWRETRQSGHMPVPAALLGVTGLFAALSLIAEIAPPARKVVTITAWGLDLAGLLQVLPAGLFGQVQKAQQAEAQASGQSQSQSTGTEAV
jgi:hypothetical protein